VMIAVTDEGAGMQPSVRARAFEPFFTTKDVGKGSGLGLSMVHGFAKQSHGHVTLQSEPGLGTTVRLYLPASPVRPLDAATPPAGNQAAPRGQGTVLVVEDDPFMRGYAVRCLQSLGYRAISAADGDEALAKIAEAERIDLLFGDIVLSGNMNGWELAARAKQLRPEIKVLLTAGYTSDALAKRGHLKGDAEVLDKPYSKSDLASRVRETLDGR
jgi:CheY-like chemotaxis protein